MNGHLLISVVENFVLLSTIFAIVCLAVAGAAKLLVQRRILQTAKQYFDPALYLGLDTSTRFGAVGCGGCFSPRVLDA